MAEIERTTEVTGEDPESAISAGLERLQVDRDQVEVEILEEGSRGVFGIGSREAHVRLTVKSQKPSSTTTEQRTTRPKPAPTTEVKETKETAEPPSVEDDESEVAIGQEALLELLALMGINQVTLEVRRAKAAPGEQNPPWILDLRGENADVLIGRRGSTLAALQRITRLIVGQEIAGRVNLVIDVNQYKERRKKKLAGLANRLADQAIRTNRTVILEPMPPNERRIIHLTLRKNPKVETKSIGERDQRKVTIIPQS